MAQRSQDLDDAGMAESQRELNEQMVRDNNSARCSEVQLTSELPQLSSSHCLMLRGDALVYIAF